ncbi:MAG: hypothetical protein AABZ30_03905 [Myxococcota bacterium]
MRRIPTTFLLAVWPCAALAQADDDEPRATQRAKPAPAEREEPGEGDEPEPEGLKAAGDEPGEGSDEPEEARRRLEAMAAAEALPPELYGIGLRLRYISVPHWLLQAFLKESTQLHSWAVAGEFAWMRTEMFTFLTSVELASYDADDGNFLGKDEDPAQKTDYIQFRDLSMVSVDASFLWDHALTPKVALVWGAGLGVMIPMGDVWRASATSGCTADSAGDESTCYPTVNPANPDSPPAHSEAALNDLAPFTDAFEDGDAAFTQDLWPAYPLLSALFGVRVTLHRHFQMRFDTGFHNALFLGTSSQYFF